MKRKDFLKITGCSVKQFDNLRLRDQLPFVPNSRGDLYDAEGKHADYSLLEAFQLRVFMDASANKGLSIEAAQYISGNCVWHLRRAAEAVPSGDADLWIFYAQGHLSRFEDSREAWTPRTLGAGRLEDLPAFVDGKLAVQETQFITVINATMASARVLGAAMMSNMIVPDDEPVKPLWDRDYQIIDTGSED